MIEAVIGLKRGTVELVAHRPQWKALFEEERLVLTQTIGDFVIDIQHVGSTAVPGLDAKPILDIAASVASLSAISGCRAPLCRIGYLDRGDGGQDGGYLFVRQSAPEFRTHHLHIVTADDPQWKSYLWFRDLLRRDDSMRAAYAALKKASAEKFPADRGAYTLSKQDFIRGLLATSFTPGAVS
ncbi:MAG TPA: GrpB family protein [Polyangiaceae bacterium]